MKKKLYVFACITIPLFSATHFLPEKVQLPIGRFLDDTKNIFYNTYYNAYVSPYLLSCAFQQSKLACMQAFNEHPINPNCFIDEELLKHKMSQGLPKWALTQIQQDLSTFGSISKADLKRYLIENNTTENALMRIQVKNKKITVTYNNPKHRLKNKISLSHTAGTIQLVIKYLAKNGYIPDSDFILAIGDFYEPINDQPVPIFTFAKNLDIPVERSLILIPDWQNLGSARDLRQRIRNTKKLIAWNDKKNQLFWRGGKLDSTGFRKKFIAFSENYPSLIDAQYVNTYGQGAKPNKRFVSPEEHLNYKYLISIDGLRCSWERLIWHLHSNSLIFKHQTNQIQWYYNGIKPYEHYIPITDEHSILASIAWAENHPHEVQTIIHNASTFVEDNLSLEDMYHYIAVLLQEYHKKLAD